MWIGGCELKKKGKGVCEWAAGYRDWLASSLGAARRHSPHVRLDHWTNNTSQPLPLPSLICSAATRRKPPYRRRSKYKRGACARAANETRDLLDYISTRLCEVWLKRERVRDIRRCLCPDEKRRREKEMKNCCYLSILTSKADPHLCGRPFSFVCFQLQLNEGKASFASARRYVWYS